MDSFAYCPPRHYAPPASLLTWARENGGDIILTDDVNLAIDKVQTVVTVYGFQWAQVRAVDAKISLHIK